MPRARHSANKPSAAENIPWIIRAPFEVLLIIVVIGIAAGLVAITFLPAFAGVDTLTQRIQAKMKEAEATFHKIKFSQTSTIYDANGNVLSTVNAGENRVLVKINKVAPVVKDAVLAIEDHGFYEHAGVDAESIIRAAIVNLASGRIEQGGSTITQQLVKNAQIGSTAQTFERKFQEAALAGRMEREYTKDEILELYLNQIYLANGVYGIGTASQYYFNKPASKLNLPQAALLAGMIQSPENYDPTKKSTRTAAKLRRGVVLSAMVQYGYITPQQAAKARKAPIALKTAAYDHKEKLDFYTHHALYEMLSSGHKEWDFLGSNYKERLRALGTGGYRIYTTYQPRIEDMAQKVAEKRLGSGSLDTGIATVEPGTGKVLLMLSGKNYQKDQYDLVATEKTERGQLLGTRQPGSSFKAFTLVAAFEEGIPPTTRYPSNSPMNLGPAWDNACHCVYNAEPFGGFGNIDLFTATTHSVNVVFAQLVLQVGPDTVAEVADRMGVKDSNLEAVPSITLGSEEVSPLEMASAYATLANHGTYCAPYFIDRIVSANGKVVYKHKPNCKEVIDPDVADLTTNLLEGPIQSGTGTAAQIGRPAAGKTGTSQDKADLWFVGYTPQLSTAVWVGNPRGRVPTDYYGGTIAAPIWHDVMLKLLKGVPSEGFRKAPSLKAEKFGVPDVIGMSENDAMRTISRAGFSPFSREVDSTEPEGTVVAQNPAAGSTVPKGSNVTIDVSSGKPPEAVVPSVGGMILYEAQRALKGAGFGVSVQYVEVSKKSQNRIVLSQAPGGGTKAQPGSTVTINVGKYVGGGDGGGGDPGGGGGP